MKKVNKNKINTIDEVLAGIEDIISNNENSIQSSEIVQLKELVIKGKKVTKREFINVIMTVALLIFVTILFVISSIENTNLRNDINSKENIIVKLQNENIILNQYVQGDNKKDSVNLNMFKTNSPAFNYDTKKFFTYKDLKMEYERLHKENIINESNLRVSKAEIKLLNTKVSYFNSHAEMLSLQLKLIQKTYGISVTDEDIIAPKADSAFLLLPVFRDRLRYDKKCKCWYVRK